MTAAAFVGSGISLKRMQRVSLLVVFLTAALLSTCGEAKTDTSRTLDIINRSGHRVSIYWINRWKNDELVLNTEEPLLNGADSRINSYVNHEFEIQEQPHKKTGKCSGENGECLKAQFQVNTNHGQCKSLTNTPVIWKDNATNSLFFTFIHRLSASAVTILAGLKLELEDDRTRAKQQANAVVQECKSQFADRQGEDPYQVLEEMAACIQNSVNASLEEKNDEIDFQAQVRSKLGERLTVYACSDVNATTSESIENKTWTFQHKKYPVKVLLDRPASKIYLMETFVSAEECQAAEKAIQTTRVDANGLVAKKGGVAFPKEGENGNELSAIASRIYAFVEAELDADLEMENREELFMLHYEGKDKNPDQYAPHCDGKCDGSNVEAGDRIATIIMYCEVPGAKGAGGATHFPNSGSHIRPKAGDAVFISYVDPKTGIMDTGLTNHTGCPVTGGDKKVLTHKIRLAR